MNLLKVHESRCSLVADGAIQFLFQKNSKSSLTTLLVPRNPVVLSELLMLGFCKKSSERIIIMACPPGVPSAQVGTCAWTLKQSFSCFFCLVLASFL